MKLPSLSVEVESGSMSSSSFFFLDVASNLEKFSLFLFNSKVFTGAGMSGNSPETIIFFI